MSRNVLLGIVALSAALIVAAAVADIRWKSEKDARARAAWSDAIRTVVDTTREPGWVETFDAARAQPLAEYDARWRPLFGRLLVDSRLAAVIGDPEGGWQRDGGDDYAFRAADI